MKTSSFKIINFTHFCNFLLPRVKKMQIQLNHRSKDGPLYKEREIEKWINKGQKQEWKTIGGGRGGKEESGARVERNVVSSINDRDSNDAALLQPRRGGGPHTSSSQSRAPRLTPTCLSYINQFKSRRTFLN